MKTAPVVTIVGRPNVGKSTLFNRLTRSRRSLVHNMPGVTRDRIAADAAWPGGHITLIDTGGLLLSDDEPMISLIREQAEVAIAGADAIIFLLDGESGPLPEDQLVAELLRASGSPVIPVVNKSDRSEVELQSAEFYCLGLGDPVLISAEHGMGLNELWESLEPHIWPTETGDEDEDAVPANSDEIHVAIIGRPNVGKSSLLNRLVGDSRSVVSEIPGTTRDAVDEVIDHECGRFRFVDTAGIRRKGRTDRGPEVLSVVLARRHLERSHLCLLVIDATEGITRQDAHIAGYAWDAGRALALVINKWDVIDNRERARERIEDEAAKLLKFLPHAPRIYLSALTAKGVHRLFPSMVDLDRAHAQRTQTAQLNPVIKKAWAANPPPSGGRKEPRFYYATQTSSRPPNFVLFTNLNRKPHFSYMRYLENILREAFDLAGVPIRVIIRGRKT